MYSKFSPTKYISSTSWTGRRFAGWGRGSFLPPEELPAQQPGWRHLCPLLTSSAAAPLAASDTAQSGGMLDGVFCLDPCTHTKELQCCLFIFMLTRALPSTHRLLWDNQEVEPDKTLYLPDLGPVNNSKTCIIILSLYNS